MATITVSRSAATLSRADLLRYRRINERRLEIQRIASSLNKQEAEIVKRAAAYLKARKLKSKELHGFAVRLKKVPSRVAWKEAYVDAKGERAAKNLMDNAPLVEVVEIEKT